MDKVRIVIADADAAYRRALKDAFRLADYLVVGEAPEARSALQIVFQKEPRVVVLDPFIPGNEGLDIAGIIHEHRVAPVVAVLGSDKEIEEQARVPGVYGILVKPLADGIVQPVIESALVNFERAMKLEKELKELRRLLEERKLVEKAKGLLMDSRGLTEREAHKYMQKQSMDRCIPLARVAKNIILHLGG